MRVIQVKHLRPGDLFVPRIIGMEEGELALCIASTRFQAEEGGYGNHVRFLTGRCRLDSLFWREDVDVEVLTWHA